MRSGSASTSRSLENERRSRDARRANVTPEAQREANDRAAGAREPKRGTQRRHGRADTTVEHSSVRDVPVQEQGRTDPERAWRAGGRIRQAPAEVKVLRRLCAENYIVGGWQEPSDLSVTEARRRGVARLVADAAHGTEAVVDRHGRPVAAVVDFERFTELDAAARRPARPGAGDRPGRRRRRPPQPARRRGRRLRARPGRLAPWPGSCSPTPRSTTCGAPARSSPPSCWDGCDSWNRSPTQGRRCSATGFRVLTALDGDARIVHDTEGATVTVRSVWVDGARTGGEAYAETLERMPRRRPVGAGHAWRRPLRRLRPRHRQPGPVPQRARSVPRCPTGWPTPSVEAWA